MNAAIAGIHLIGGWLPLVVDGLAAISAIALVGWLVVGAVGRRARARWALIAGVSALVGAVIGLVLSWLLSDQLNLFDVSLTPTSRSWVAGAFAVVAIAAAGALGRSRRTTTAAPRRAAVRGRRALAAFVAVTALAAGTLGVNADFGQYTTIGSLSNASIAPPVPPQVLADQANGAPGTVTSTHRAQALWKAAVATGMPSHGLVGSVTIPATVSQFRARGAYVYLPPAALVAHPVALPVLIMLSGQPGSPSNVFSSGQLASIFDAFAAAHGGLAPIVVAPDQLGAPELNPMCVDGTLGASASYLTVDVPNWIRSHLTVQASPAAWAIGGFSQGGTCSIQLGAAHPDLFSSIIDVSGQLAPKNGGLKQTIAIGFGGDAAAYRAALPEALLARHAPYSNTVAVFGVGQLDSRYGPVAAVMTAAAQNAGMSATEAISPGTGHDWHTVQWVLSHALQPIYARLGLVNAS